MTGEGSALEPDPTPHAPPPAAFGLRRRRALALLAILAYGALLWLWGAGRTDVHGSMEGSRALVPKQMMRMGDYVVPRRGAEVYLAKPPLFYWAVIATSRAAGGEVTAASVRAVAALSMLAIVLLVYAAALRFAGERTAWIAALVAAASPFALEARDGNLDTLLGLGVALSLVGAFFVAEETPRARAWAVVCGAGLAMGLLTKGPVVLLFLVPTLALYAAFRRQGPVVRSRRALVPYLSALALSVWLVSLAVPVLGGAAALGYVVPAAMTAVLVRQGTGRVGRPGLWLGAAAAAIALAAPWVVLVTQRLGIQEILRDLGREFWHERLGEVGTSNRGPIWTYAAEFTLKTLPWILFVPIAFLPRYGSGLETPRGRLVLFLRCWLLGSLVLFTVVGEARRLRYVIPALPAAALLAGDVISRAWDGTLDGRLRRHAGRIARGVAYALCLAPLGIVALALHAGAGGSAWTVVAAAVAAVGAAVAGVLLRRRRVYLALLVAMSVVMLSAKVLGDFAESPLVNAKKSSRPGCERIHAQVPAGETLWLAGLPPHPAAFYLDALPVEPLLADPPRLASRARLFVCLDSRDLPALATPPGFDLHEVTRVSIPGGVLVLVRLDRRPG